MVEEFKESEGERVADANWARIVNKILSDTDLRRGLLQSSLPLTIFPGYEVALKTGTTQDYRDAWTFGYTPFLVVGVWAGNTENTRMVKQGSSIVAAIPMWSNFMREAIKNYQSEAFVPPTPQTPSMKPMLNGEYVTLENGKPVAHTILYYANRNDPLGPAPPNPADDPQFANWELGVREWLSEHQPFLQDLSIPLSFPTSSDPSQASVETAGLGNRILIRNVVPASGETMGSGFTVSADIASGEELRVIELRQNGEVRNVINVSGRAFRYQYYFFGPLEGENLFEIRVLNAAGTSETSSFVVKRKN